jgi:hypothetical protein
MMPELAELQAAVPKWMVQTLAVQLVVLEVVPVAAVVAAVVQGVAEQGDDEAAQVPRVPALSQTHK